MDPGLLVPIAVVVLLAVTFFVDSARTAREEGASRHLEDLFGWLEGRLGIERAERSSSRMSGLLDGVPIELEARTSRQGARLIATVGEAGEGAGFVAEQLFVLHPSGERSAEAAEALRDHPSARARLFAAIRLARGGTALLGGVGDRIDERVFRQALAWAADHVDARPVAAAALEALELGDEELLVEACGALARLGPLEAVGALHRLAERHRWSDDVREAAQASAAAIRDRLGGEQAEGALGISADCPRDGALEFADGPGAGGLELAEDSDPHS